MTSVPRHTKKRNPGNKHYGFAQVPRIVIRGNKYKSLSLAEIGLYNVLKDICGDDGECYYSLRNLAKIAHSSDSTLSRLIPKLVKSSLITAELLKTGNKGWETWHIRIVDIWEENDALYRPADDEKSASKQDALNGHHTKVLQNEAEVLQNEAVSSDDSHSNCFKMTDKGEYKENKKGEGTSPPPLTFPSEKTLPGETLFPSKQIPPPALSNVPPDVQAVIDAYLPISLVPVDVKKPKFIAAATFLARFQPTTEKLSACRKWMIDHDKKGRFNDHVPNLVEISYDYGNWKADMARKQDQAQPSKPGVGVSGKPKIDTTSDDYRAFAQAMGGN